MTYSAVANVTAGLSRVTSGLADFAVTDGALGPAQLSTGLLQVPLIGSALVMAFNLPSLAASDTFVWRPPPSPPMVAHFRLAERSLILSVVGRCWTGQRWRPYGWATSPRGTTLPSWTSILSWRGSCPRRRSPFPSPLATYVETPPYLVPFDVVVVVQDAHALTVDCGLLQAITQLFMDALSTFSPAFNATLRAAGGRFAGIGGLSSATERSNTTTRLTYTEVQPAPTCIVRCLANARS